VLVGMAALAALVLLDQLFGGRIYAGWPLHPFALPVLWAAAAHGLVAGTGVAVIAALLRLALALATDSFTANAWVEPLAWPLAAALVGILSDRLRARAQAAEAEAAAAAAERMAIAEANERLAARATELEARLSARLQAETALFDAARTLGQGVEGVLRGATRLTRAATGCTACSFWLAEGLTLHLVSAEGWPQEDALPRVYPRGPLPDAIQQGQLLLATRPQDRLALGQDGIMAAPVRSPWDGTVLGMVKVEDIGFAALTPDSVASLAAVAGWLGTALAEAHTEASHGASRTGGVVAGEEANRSITMMTALARRVGFDLALIWVEIPPGAGAGTLMEAARAAMADAFRESDILLQARQEERRLAVLLPGAAVQGAQAAAARLRTQIAEWVPGTAGRSLVGVALLHRARASHG
jgi:hypothetical protein